MNGKTASWLVRCGLLGGVAALLSLASASARQAPGADDWKYDIVYQRKGPGLPGLIVDESGGYVRIKRIVRQPGRPTIIFNDLVPQRDVERIDRLGPTDREELQKRLEALAHERETLSTHLKTVDPSKHPDAFTLAETDWPPDPQRKDRALGYSSTYFRLVSTATPEVTRLAAIQLEQVYDAYARCLPPRVDKEKGRPTLIMLTGSLDDYEVLLRGEKHNFFNPAFYDVKRNQIVCASDLQRSASRREEIRKQHAQALADLEQRRADLNKAYKGRVPPEMLVDLSEATEQIKKTEKSNDEAYNLARGRLFQRLYHEAFHAYLVTWVYPDEMVPVWLNEGLAQIFETAIVEAGELRVGFVGEKGLGVIREALAHDKLPPLAELLASGSDQFLINHAREQQMSDRYYLASWGLAHYLTFERRLLGTKALDDYVKALQRGTDPLEAFRDLVGVPLPQFEKEYRQYLQQLRPDGTTGGK